MNISQIKYFVSTVQNGSFSAAATKQFITAQGVSKAIADLEKEIGTQLLVRKNRGVVPTVFGEEFYKRALLVERSFENLEVFAQTYTEIPQDTLSIKLLVCAPNFLGMDKVRSNLETFMSMNLGVPASVSFELKDPCFKALQRGTTDCVIILGEVEATPDYEVIVIGTLPCGLQMSQNHPLAHKPFVSLSDLADTPVYFWESHDTFNKTVEKLLREKGIDIGSSTGDPLTNNFDQTVNENGAFFIPRIAAIDEDALDTVAKSFDPNDNFVIPLCLVMASGSASPKVQAIRNLPFVKNRPVSTVDTNAKISQAVNPF